MNAVQRKNDSNQKIENESNSRKYQTSRAADGTILYHDKHNYDTSLAEKVYVWYASFTPGWRTAAIRFFAIIFSPVLILVFIPVVLIDKLYRLFKTRQLQKTKSHAADNNKKIKDSTLTPDANAERKKQIIENEEQITDHALIIELFGSIENYLTAVVVKNPDRIATPAEWRSLGLVVHQQAYVQGEIDYTDSGLNKKFDKKFAWLMPVEKWIAAMKTPDDFVFATNKWRNQGQKPYDLCADTYPDPAVNDSAMYLPGIQSKNANGRPLADMTGVGIITPQDFYECYIARNREAHLQNLQKMGDVITEKLGPWKHHGCMLASRLLTFCCTAHKITDDQRYRDVFDKLMNALQQHYNANKNKSNYGDFKYSYENFYSQTEQRLQDAIQRENFNEEMDQLKEKYKDQSTVHATPLEQSSENSVA